MARPIDFTKELGDKVCQSIANGWSMRTTCNEEDMPSMFTVFRWLREEESFQKQYARACEERTEAHNEQLLDYGEEALELAQNCDPKAANAVVSAVKLKADNLKWVMSKMKPKKYGDKVDVTSAGEAIKGNTILFKDFKDDGTDSQ